MTSFVRGLVSKKKKRFKQDGFDLDLTYVTPQIIAMGYPSDGFESMYRNPAQNVVRLFEQKHKDHVWVFNLCSERAYDPSLFGGRATRYPFNDHNPPPLALIRSFCEEASAWLAADKDNVVAVHCKAGKGRTGVMISALLMFLKHWPNAQESLHYYGKMRAHDQKGVTIPSQSRFVEYFGFVIGSYDAARMPQVSPAALNLESVVAVSMLKDGAEGGGGGDETRSFDIGNSIDSEFDGVGKIIENDTNDDEDEEEEEEFEEEVVAYEEKKKQQKQARASMVAFGDKPMNRPLSLCDDRFVHAMKTGVKEMSILQKKSGQLSRGGVPNSPPLQCTMLIISAPPKLFPFNPSFTITCFGSQGMADSNTPPIKYHSDDFFRMGGPVMDFDRSKKGPLEFPLPNLPVANEVCVEFFNTTSAKKKILFRFWLHTSFFPRTGVIVLNKKELDKANKDKKNKKLVKDFTVTLCCSPMPTSSSSSTTLKKIKQNQNSGLEEKTISISQEVINKPRSKGSRDEGVVITEEFKDDGHDEISFMEQDSKDYDGHNKHQVEEKELGVNSSGRKIDTDSSWFETPFVGSFDTGLGLGAVSMDSVLASVNQSKDTAGETRTRNESLTGLGLTGALTDVSQGMMGFGSNSFANLSNLMSMNEAGAPPRAGSPL